MSLLYRIADGSICRIVVTDGLVVCMYGLGAVTVLFHI